MYIQIHSQRQYKHTLFNPTSTLTPALTAVHSAPFYALVAACSKDSAMVLMDMISFCTVPSTDTSRSSKHSMARANSCIDSMVDTNVSVKVRGKRTQSLYITQNARLYSPWRCRRLCHARRWTAARAPVVAGGCTGSASPSPRATACTTVTRTHIKTCENTMRHNV